MAAIPGIVFLIVSWITALVTLVIFLESWFALTRRSHLLGAKARDDRGLVTVLLPLRSLPEVARRTVDSVLGQTYPFVELIVLYDAGDVDHQVIVRDLSAVPSHVSVRPLPFGGSLESNSDRIRALETSESSIGGSWILLIDSDVVLEPHALESAVEFVSSEEITALGLVPGSVCRSFVQKLVAPSLEWFVRMIRALDRAREQAARVHPTAPFMLFHSHTHSVVNRMNRMPGILNESGWTLWSYRVEGLRTFHGDGSGWISRDASPRALLSRVQTSPLSGGRVRAFLAGSLLIAVISVAGMLFGALGDAAFLHRGILYLSAFSYSLMATSYFFYSRRLGAASWMAPLWFIPHCWALMLTVREFGRAVPEAPGYPVVPGRRSQVPTRE